MKAETVEESIEVGLPLKKPRVKTEGEDKDAHLSKRHKAKKATQAKNKERPLKTLCFEVRVFGVAECDEKGNLTNRVIRTNEKLEIGKDGKPTGELILTEKDNDKLYYRVLQDIRLARSLKSEIAASQWAAEVLSSTFDSFKFSATRRQHLIEEGHTDEEIKALEDEHRGVMLNVKGSNAQRMLRDWFGGISATKMYEMKNLWDIRMKELAQLKDAPCFYNWMFAECLAEARSKYFQKDAKLGVSRNLRMVREGRSIPSFDRSPLAIAHYPDSGLKNAWFEFKGKYGIFMYLRWDKELGYVCFQLSGVYEFWGFLKDENGEFILDDDGKKKQGWCHSVKKLGGVDKKKSGSARYTLEQILGNDWYWSRPLLNVKKVKGRNKLSIQISYRPPVEKYDVDMDRTLQVSFHPDNPHTGYIQLVPTGRGVSEADVEDVMEGVPIDAPIKKEKYSDRYAWGKLTLTGLIEELRDFEKQKSRYEDKLNSYIKFGYHSPAHVKVKQWRYSIHRTAEKRDAEIKRWCNTWANHIIRVAIRHRCGVIMVFNMPSLCLSYKTPEMNKVIKIEWQWGQFKFKLNYKSLEKGLKVLYAETKKASDVSVDLENK